LKELQDLMEKTSCIKLPGLSGRIEALAINRHGLLAVGAHQPRANENEVWIWDLSRADCVHRLQTGFNGILSLSFSPDDQLLGVGGGGYFVNREKREYTKGIEVWRLQDFKKLTSIGDELFFVKSLSFSPDGLSLLSTNHPSPTDSRSHLRTECVRLWRTSDFKQVGAFAEGSKSVHCACFSADQRSVVFAHTRGHTASVEFSPKEFRSLSLPQIDEAINRAEAREKEAIERGDVIPVPLIRTWNLHENHEDKSFDIYKGMVTGIAVSPDGQLLASSGSILTMWNFTSRARILDLKDETRFPLTHCLGFSPDGRLLVTGTGDHAGFGDAWENCGVQVWDVSTNALIARLPHQTPVYSVAFSHDGRKLVAGGESELIVWQLYSQSLV
jgi:WD40 domain-containing protein